MECWLFDTGKKINNPALATHFSFYAQLRRRGVTTLGQLRSELAIVDAGRKVFGRVVKIVNGRSDIM